MTPFVGDQYVGLVQQSVAAAVVNDGWVGGDWFSLKSICTVTCLGGVSFKV